MMPTTLTTETTGTAVLKGTEETSTGMTAMSITAGTIITAVRQPDHRVSHPGPDLPHNLNRRRNLHRIQKRVTVNAQVPESNEKNVKFENCGNLYRQERFFGTIFASKIETTRGNQT